MIRRVPNWLALIWTVGVTGWLLLTPQYATMTTSISAGRTTRIGAGREGKVVERQQSSTLLGVNGPKVLIPLSIPLLLTTLPLLGRKPRRRQVVSTACFLTLVAFSLIGGFTIGLFYLPAVLLLGLSKLFAGRESPAAKD